jgi:hypothetical protein
MTLLTSYRDNDFTQKQLRGLDLVLKSTFKRFNFFIGDWVFANDYERWHTHLYIDAKVDVKKLSEFVNLPIKSYWEDYLKRNPDFSSTFLFSPLDIGERGSEEYENGLMSSMNLKKEIDDFASNLYEHMPEDMKIKWKSQRNYIYDCKISLSKFIFIYNV